MFSDRQVWVLGPTVLRVESEGFHPEEVDLSPDQQEKSIEVTLRELPGQLRAETRPPAPGAEWSVDGKPVVVGARLDIELEPGAYTLTVDSPRHQTESVQIEIFRGKESDLVVDLVPVHFQLEVITKPPGATVSVNGLAQGPAPGKWEIDIGTHEIEVTLPGYKSVSETVQVTKENSEIQKNYVLLQEDAFVTFQLRPEGGVLLLGGRIQKNFNEIPVQALVAHRAIYRKDGHTGVEATFQLQPGERTTLEMSLEEIVGEVEVVSKPAADVLVDGKPVGTTPLRLTLSAVEHEIVVTRKGYEAVKRKLTPTPDKLSRVDLQLETEKEFRIRNAPKTVVNSVGMPLRLFIEPGKFVMGSPRGEKGRGPNEFLRSVQLVRAFYVGVHEVTQKQRGEFPGVAQASGSGDLPATDVTWIEAVQFCNWLSKREGFGVFYRLDGDRYLGVNGDADGLSPADRSRVGMAGAEVREGVRAQEPDPVPLGRRRKSSKPDWKPGR